MSNKKTFKNISKIICSAFILNGCSHYAPGYDGWTSEQVESVKEAAKSRYYSFPKKDNSVLGVNYENFDVKTYHIFDEVRAPVVECEGATYEKLRRISDVFLVTSVCLNSLGKVNRIVFRFIGVDNVATSDVFNLAQNEFKENYGANVFPGLENRFMTREQYESLYFKVSPSRSDLLSFDRALISDYITSVDVMFSNTLSRSDGYDRLIFDVKLRDYEALQKKQG